MIDKLEFILALAREKHFGRAAEACGVTQPTLSAGVRQLEAQMGVLLVHRGSRFQGFTPEGQRVLEWARRIIGDTRTMREEVSALRHGLVGRLRIAAILPHSRRWLRSRRPIVQSIRCAVHRLVAHSMEIPALENLEIEAGLTYLDNEPLGRVNTVTLYKENYRLLTAADAPIGNRDRVTWGRPLHQVAPCPSCR